MSPADALAVLAFQNGVDIALWLDAESLARVAGYVSQAGGAGGGEVRRPGRQRQPSSSKGRDVVLHLAGVAVGKIPGLTARHALEAKKMAEKAYPLLYLFENSARDVITRVLLAGLGDHWWDQLPVEVQNQAALNLKKQGDEAWHSKRAEPIQCVDLPQLKTIVAADHLWPFFKPLFSRKTWFESVVDDINVSRRVVAHMNPLSDDDIRAVETGFRKWVTQLQAKEALLP